MACKIKAFVGKRIKIMKSISNYLEHRNMVEIGYINGQHTQDKKKKIGKF